MLPTAGMRIAGKPISPPRIQDACGWTAVSELLAAIQADDAYVNVDTNDGGCAAGCGTGDFPGGEIRGS